MPVGIAASGGSPRKLEALELFDGLERRYDALSAAFSFWQDPRWRSAMVDALGLRGGERVLDVATGTGLVAAELRARADCSIVARRPEPGDAGGGTRALRVAGRGAPVELAPGGGRARCRSPTRASTP